jgi:hypothetical protein
MAKSTWHRARLCVHTIVEPRGKAENLLAGVPQLHLKAGGVDARPLSGPCPALAQRAERT